MNKVIYRYCLNGGTKQGNTVVKLIKVPSGASIFHCGMSKNEASIWLICNPGNPLEDRWFKIVVTGAEFEYNSSMQIIGSIQTGDDIYYHIFEYFPE